ncbi:DUF5689 domain-containing protein [uncultured Algibacter sp.]|uniref:DUF5689 domain-containing protein n=1 Tax=uncultured Algibacter sp. TaxID=298659 RepID=UPI00262159AA|nr:DUF5689 domain-containing protein [uncultured Algibacter sp.]
MKCLAFPESEKNLIMNKVNKIISLLSVFAFIIVLASCVHDDDYDTPNLTINEPDIPTDKITTFKAIQSRLEQAQANGDPTAIIGLDEELYIEGYVVSSDKASNFFEELIIQNKIDDSDPTEDPRLGFKVEVNVGSLYNTYEFGRKVYVKLSGLTIGVSNGVLVIAKGEGEDLEQIQEFEYKDIVIRSSEVSEITPKISAIEDLTEDDENTYIQLDNVQFGLGELPLTFAGEPSDNFDGFRTILSCDATGEIELQTSTFADFKSLQIPQDRGSIKGIYSRDFRDDFSVLITNSAGDISFDNGQRCDPVFEENFNDGLDGWEVTNTVGTQSWRAAGFGGVSYARGTAFSSGNIVQMVSWLISPSIDFDAQENEEMILEIGDAFSNGQPLKAYYSEDYSAGQDPSIATWVEIGSSEIDALEDNTGFYDNIYERTNPIDMSGISGNAVIAFVYDSADATVSTNIDISLVKISVP